MAIKIIERNEFVSPTFRCRCRHCTSLLEYGALDLNWCDAMAYDYLKCPVCGNDVPHRSENLVQTGKNY